MYCVVCICLAVCVMGHVDGFLVSLNKTVNKSSVYENPTGTEAGFASLAVDGNKTRKFDECLCCALTNHTYDPWYILDLGKDFIVERLEILGREKPNVNDTLLYQHFGNMSINVRNENGTDVYTETIEEKIYVVERNFSNDIQARYIYMMVHGRKGHFTVCELSVYGDCVDGQFDHDNDCNRNCHCAQGPCNKTSGICPIGTGTFDRCLPGYRNETCENVCLHGYYGQNCASTCGSCSNRETCHHINGTCTSCAPGYLTQYCNQDCSLGMYGQNCTELCGQCRGGNDFCHFVDGDCSNGCEAGYNGSTCKNNCTDNTYGYNCNETCGMCKDNAVCNKMTGVCPSGCQIGYKPGKCSEQCDPGTHGQDCAQVCGMCSNKAACHHVTGECMSCNPGYVMPYCNQTCNPGNYGQACTQTCGQCLDEDYCDVVDGVCPRGCDAGYTSPNCKQTCDDHKYGYNCSMTCGKCKGGDVCDKMNGTCPSGCEPGYQSITCSQECPDGSFGEQCRYRCGPCLDGIPCNKTTGLCAAGCGPGYIGTYCNESCSDGLYGINCSQSCSTNCINSTCNAETGYCDHGCIADYSEPLCTEKGLATEGGEGGGAIGGVVGGAVGGVVAIVIVVVVVVIIMRRRRNSRKDERNGTNFSDDIFRDPKKSVVMQENDYDHVAEEQMGAGTVDKENSTAKKRSSLINLVKSKSKKYDKQNGFNGRDKSKQGDTNRNITSNKGISIDMKGNGRVKFEKTAETESASAKSKPVGNQSTDGNEYYGFVTRNTDLEVKQLWDYIAAKKMDSSVMFYQEYARLKSGLLHPCKVAYRFRTKNRYKQIYAYDHNRVTLSVDNKEESEYINASFINGFEKSKKFIASQGPVTEMVADFWRMVWQYNCKQIVMLTNLVEMGTYLNATNNNSNVTEKYLAIFIVPTFPRHIGTRHGEKCIMYWAEDDPVIYGNIKIEAVSVDTMKDFEVRQFKIWKNNESPRLVSQYHYKAWPDKDVPDSTWSLVNFWLHVTKETAKLTDSVPVVVHCSAGVGRTGTYIALDILSNEGKKTGIVRPLQTVTNLREQRPSMVQTKEQYVFLHEAVADTLHFGTHYVWSSQFEEVYNHLTQVDPDTKISRLHTQYKLIIESIEELERVLGIEEENDSEYTNINLSKVPTPIENETSRMKDSGLARELGAVFIPDYKGRLSMILSKSPTSVTMEKFWCLIKEHHVKTVIMVTDTSSQNYKESGYLGMSSKGTQNRVKVSLKEEKVSDFYTERLFQYSKSLKSITTDTVCQVQYTKWTDCHDVPGDPRSINNLLEHVLTKQYHLSEQEPILIHCTTGYFRSGLVSALLNEVCRLRDDGGHLNIVETVKLLKQKQKLAIPNFEQYQFIYDVILAKVCGDVYEVI